MLQRRTVMLLAPRVQFTSVALRGGRTTAAASTTAAATAAAAVTSSSSSISAQPTFQPNACVDSPRTNVDTKQCRIWTTDELVKRITSHSRHRPAKGPQLAQLQEMLTEVAQARAALLSPRALREILLVCQAAGLHRLCLDIFYKRSLTHLRDLNFSLLDSVVESAYTLASLPDFERLAAIGTAKLLSVTSEIVSDIALCRILWRIMCLCMEGRLSPRACTQVAQDIWTKHMMRYNEKNLLKIRSDEFFATMLRFIRYSYAVDMGEYHCFRLFYEFGVLRSGTLSLPREKKIALHVALVRSCRPGGWAKAAEKYFNKFVVGEDTIEEQLAYNYLSILYSARDYVQLTKVGSVLISRNASLSEGMLAMIAQAASEVPMRDVVLKCYDHICSSETQPTAFNVFQALAAMGKCGAPAFDAAVREAVAKQRFVATEESIAFLTLQFGLNTSRPWTIAKRVLHSLNSKGVQLSERVAGQLILLFFRIESPKLLPIFRHAFDDLGMIRSQWVENLVMWADRRRGFLSQDERRYIIGVIDGKSSRFSLDGLRPQVGQIRHDMEHDGPATFRATGKLSPDPTIYDPRTYFLRRQRNPIAGMNSIPPVVGPTASVEVHLGHRTMDLPLVASSTMIGPTSEALSGPVTDQKAQSNVEVICNEQRSFFRLHLAEVLKDMQESPTHLPRLARDWHTQE